MRKTTTIGLLGIIALIIAGAVLFVSYHRNSSHSLTATPTDITIAQFGDFFLYLPLYVAQDKGFFSREGLNVKLISTGGDEKTWAAVLSGNAQFGMADPTFIAVSGERGQPGKVVASIVNGVPFWGVTNKASVPIINNPKDLDSFTVATFPAPSTAYALQEKMFKDAGLQPKIRQGAPGTLLTLLNTGQVDIALELEPNVSTAVSHGARIVYSLAQIYGDFSITGLTTTNDYITNNSETVQRVVNAVQAAELYIHSNPSGALEVAETRFPELSKDIASNALHRATQENIIPRQAAISSGAWKKALQLRIDVGDLKTALGMDSYVDNSFAERASTVR